MAANVLLGGCAKTYTSTKRVQDKTHFIQVGSPASSDIKLNESSIKNLTNIDQLIETTEDYQDYLSFRQRYGDYNKQISSKVTDNNFAEVERLIKDVAAKLETDNSKYAGEYLEKVKTYNYIIFKVYETKETTYQDKPNLLLGAAAIPFLPILFGIEAIEDTSRPEYKKTKGSQTLEEYKQGCTISTYMGTKMLGKYFDMIGVCPFTGERKVLAENLPISQLKQELENYQNKASK